LCLLTLFGLAVPAAASLAAEPLSARQIMQQVNDRDDGDYGISDLRQVLIDKSGHQRVREIRSYTRDQGKDEQRILFFKAPSDVKDTGFLTYDYDQSGRDDDQWLYLPALNKSKRIASNDKSGSFMGSDLNFSDMTRRDLDQYNFRLLKEVKVNGHNCWLIESIPKTREERDNSGYKKELLFVRQDNFIVVRAVQWTSEGNRIKYMEVKELEQIDGVWVRTRIQVVTKKGKQMQHKTVLEFDNVRFNQDLPDDTWTQRRLSQGL
jgi:outer membrane lipoprotein-sorting protein